MNTDSSPRPDGPESSVTPDVPQPVTTPPRRRSRRQAGQQLTCGWCGGPLVVARTGRTPKWCSPTCGHRAWEQARAAATGHAAVQVIDRPVHIEVPIRVVERVLERVEVPTAPARPVVQVRRVEVPVPVTPQGPQWAPALQDLTSQLNLGLVHDRDLPALGAALDRAVAAYQRRTHPR